jgi:hypothetical protein
MTVRKHSSGAAAVCVLSCVQEEMVDLEEAWLEHNQQQSMMV